MSQEHEQNLLPSVTETDNGEMPETDNGGKLLRIIASVMGASGVSMGAFGAHALKDFLDQKGTTAMWQTATIYQLFHAAAILSMAAALSSSASKAIASNHRLAGKLMGVGNLLFSGSIYFLALDVGPKMIWGPITPIGGLLMIGGWILVGFA